MSGIQSEVKYSTGQMPNNGRMYEEFEFLLARIYLSLLPLSKSHDERDQTAYNESLKILNELAQRHNIQNPEDAARNPRKKSADGVKPASNMSLWFLVSAISTPYYIGMYPESKDGIARIKLTSLVLDLFERYDITKARNNKVSWFNSKYANKTLADLVKSGLKNL